MTASGMRPINYEGIEMFANVEMARRFGANAFYGGSYVSESLVSVLTEVEEAFESARNDPEFVKAL